MFTTPLFTYFVILIGFLQIYTKKEKETVEKKVEKTVEAKKDYSKLTVAELKAECQKNGIEVKSTMKKADLVEALSK